MNRSPEHRATAGNTPRRQPVPHLWGMYPAQPEHHTWGEQGEQPPHRHPPKIPVQHRGPYRRQAHPRPPLTPYTHTRTIMLAVHGGANELFPHFRASWWAWGGGCAAIAGDARRGPCGARHRARFAECPDRAAVALGCCDRGGGGYRRATVFGSRFRGTGVVDVETVHRRRLHHAALGGLGGQYDGEVTAIGLIYTTLHTGEGSMSFPNSTVLAAATGRRSPEHTCDTTRGG